MAEFIKTEIGTTGKGFEFNGQKYAVWYDESGLRIAPGTSAKAGNATLYDWESVEKITRQMVKSGDYLTKAEESFIDASERKRVAEQIYFFFRYGIEELPDSLGISGCNYPDSEERLSDLFSSWLYRKDGCRYECTNKTMCAASCRCAMETFRYRSARRKNNPARQ
ncbi:hypothetical protein [Butyrivibrio sp. NC3005]|uniref:hypothetical protein n=1 Tax=Butyrivibrio sp. NC3005 TaxID=1280685 RepID=UPI00041DAB36|nr:hypothetical protein [Butyrivibrio sp. NC3005]